MNTDHFDYISLWENNNWTGALKNLDQSSVPGARAIKRWIQEYLDENCLDLNCEERSCNVAIRPSKNLFHFRYISELFDGRIWFLECVVEYTCLFGQCHILEIKKESSEKLTPATFDQWNTGDNDEKFPQEFLAW